MPDLVVPYCPKCDRFHRSAECPPSVADMLKANPVADPYGDGAFRLAPNASPDVDMGREWEDGQG